MQALVDPELPFAHQADDHCLSSFCVSPAPTSALRRARSASTWASRRHRLELAVERGLVAGEVLERARLDQLVHRGGPSLHLGGLVLRPLDGKAGVGHLLADPGRRLADPHLSLGGRVLRLDDLLLGAEGLDLGRELLLGGDELLLLRFEPGDLLVEPLELGLHGALALERRAREVLAALAERLPSLRLELHEALLELRRLQLEPLLGGDDVGNAALHVLQELELLLVRVVERLARVLGAVEQLRQLRLDHQRRA